MAKAKMGPAAFGKGKGKDVSGVSGDESNEEHEVEASLDMRPELDVEPPVTPPRKVPAAAPKAANGAERCVPAIRSNDSPSD